MSRKCIRVGLAGTHSTGKSTYLRELRLRLETKGLHVGTVGDLATEARDQGFPILREHTFESTLWIIARGIALELQASRDVDVLLVDRPVADAHGYLLAALASRGETLMADEREYIEAVVRLHTRRYDVLLMTKIDPDLGIDGTKERDMDPEFRSLAANGIQRAFELAHVEPRTADCRDLAAVDLMADELFACVRSS